MNPIDRRLAWGLLAASLGGTGLASCGGGVGELIAILGYAGAGGGTYLLDGVPSSATLDPKGTCGPGGNRSCQITLAVQGNAAVPSPNTLFDHDYGVKTFDSDTLDGTTGCGGATGTVSGRRLDIPGCFNGSYRSVNEVVSDDGRTRLLFDFHPDFTSGAWYDIRNETHRLKFTASDGISTATGCELDGTTRSTRVDVNYTDSNINNNPSIFASIQRVRFTRPGGQIEDWNAEIFGASGLRLTRSGQTTLELERRRGTAADTCA